MANGDSAAAAGMDVVPGTADRRNGYDEINKTRDYLANHETSGGHPLANMSGILPVAKGGTGAANAQDARDSLAVVENQSGSGNRIRLFWTGSALQLTIDSTVIGTIPAGVSNIQFKGTNYEAGAGVLISTGGRDTTVSSSYHAAYWNGDGTLRSTPSARATKQNIKPWLMDLDTFRGIGPVIFRYKSAVKTIGQAAPYEAGFIGEDFKAAGLEYFTWPNPDGTLGGIHYEKLAVALWSVVQQLDAQHAEQIAALTKRIEALEARNGDRSV